MHPINSQPYWDERFAGDWQSKRGREQTAFFGHLALGELPPWFKRRVATAGMTACDWGCGTGEMTALLADALGIEVSGVDFAEVAIELAKQLHPGHTFHAQDWLAGGDNEANVYDVVFSSNTLEHFHSPWEVFDVLTQHARAYIALLLPFNEPAHIRHSEHFSSFSPDSFRLSRNGWQLVHASVVDASKCDSSLWPGEQILVIYAAEAEVEKAKIVVGEARISVIGENALERRMAKLEGLNLAQTEELIVESKEFFQNQIEVIVGPIVARCDQLAQMQSSAHSVVNDAILSVGQALAASHEVLLSRLDSNGEKDIAESLHRTEAFATTSGLFSEGINRLEKSIEDAVSLGNSDLSKKLESRWEREEAENLLRTEAIAATSVLLAEGMNRLEKSMEEAVSLSGLELTRRLDIHWAQERSEYDERAEAIGSTLGTLTSKIGQLEADNQSRLNALEERITSQIESIEDREARAITELRQRNRHLTTALESYNLMVGSRSWRITRPLRQIGAMLRGNYRGVEHEPIRIQTDFSRQEGATLENAASGDEVEFSLPKLPLAVENVELPDVFVWAVIDWHFRIQRPQHLARALAEAGHRVFYISNNFVNSTTPGFDAEPLGAHNRLFQVNLHLNGAPPIYFEPPSIEQLNQLRLGLAALVSWAQTRASISIAQHPYWTKLTRVPPNARVVYDCMDHHAGFEASDPKVLAAENRLVEDADLVVVTSDYLMKEVGAKARNAVIVRNAGEYSFFCKRPEEVYRDKKGRKVIGYFGAIAEWFDVEMVREVAKSHPEVVVLLVGGDTAGASKRLADQENVVFTGEVPYTQLPFFLHGFDVALLPFRVIPLTLATNPVKVYEYLASGSPVVAVDLPEIGQFGDLVRIGSDLEGFSKQVTAALAEPRDAPIRQRRLRFAMEQTWEHRAQAFDDVMGRISEPKVSVIVLTYNNWAFTEACLFSIENYSDYANLEVIVVDNASSDGSREHLRDWVNEASAAGHARRLILNEGNLGFSCGNNVGLSAASGEYLVILNNDTYVTPGWVRGMTAHFRGNPETGLVGPVTNNIGNEARVEINYKSMEDMIEKAGVLTRQHAGHAFRIPTLAFFCVMMSRSTYERVGPMDEQFGVGFFEDDDYCRRVEQKGLKNICADDVFVHHHLSASFDSMKAERRQELFFKNKEIYEKKWGEWVPHAYRERRQ